jgi:hypothetical protein
METQLISSTRKKVISVVVTATTANDFQINLQDAENDIFNNFPGADILSVNSFFDGMTYIGVISYYLIYQITPDEPSTAKK